MAHKCVLSACSPYFYAMFTCELAESNSDRITLQEVDGQALAQLIDFVYTSEIEVTEDNVQVLRIQSLAKVSVSMHLTIFEGRGHAFFQTLMDNLIAVYQCDTLHIWQAKQTW